MIKVPKDYPYKVVPVNVKGKEVVLLGVEHIPEFYEEHKDFLEEAIKNSGTVVLECDPYYLSKPESPHKGMFYLNSNFKVFFESLLNITADCKGEVYRVDPTSLGLDESYRWKLSNLTIELSSEELRMLNNMLCRESLSHFQRGCFSVGNYLGFLFDYREAGIAEGLENMVELGSNNDEDYLLAIHGASHTDDIIRYLKDRDTRRATLEGYHEEGIKGEEKIRKHSFIDDKWKKVYEKEY